MILFLISFIAGLLTVLAPCILPLLPVIVGRSLSDTTISKRRVITIVTSLGLSVFLFTLLLKVSSLFINVPPSVWTWISGGIIFIFGLVMIFPDLWDRLPFLGGINRSSNKLLMQGYKKDSIWGDVIVGASLGPIFSACSPTYFVILATVLPVSPLLGMIYLLTYTFGLCLALLLVVLIGQKIISKLRIVSDPKSWFKKILGVLFILVSIAIISGYDKKFQISILDSGFFDVTKVEQKLLNADQNTAVVNTVDDPAPVEEKNVAKQTGQTTQVKYPTLEEKAKKYSLAPDISTPDGFINTDGQPVSISQFKDKKVVLVDIWTYSCINCQRTIPYLNGWYAKYKDQGLEIIGLHTPEFSFEKVQKNVEEAVKNLGIQYPVVLDNDFSTWNAFQNEYWPREYLIDIDGYIVHDHAGEGEYDITERAIQDALAERNARLGEKFTMPATVVDPKTKIEVDSGKIGSPETYFGSARNEYLANGAAGKNGTQNLVIPDTTQSNSLYLGGAWSFVPEYAQSTGGEVAFTYQAKNVYMVASSDAGADVEVYLDSNLTKTLHIQDEMLYTIISGTDYSGHKLVLKIKSGTLKAFTFTFG